MYFLVLPHVEKGNTVIMGVLSLSSLLDENISGKGMFQTKATYGKSVRAV
jgi:hypothetical protein